MITRGLGLHSKQLLITRGLGSYVPYLQKVLVETLALSDQVSLQFSVSRTFTDTILLDDQVIPQASYTRQFLETLNLDDTLKTVIGKILTEELILTDELVREIGQALFLELYETLNITDQQELRVAYQRLLSEVIDLTDRVSATGPGLIAFFMRFILTRLGELDTTFK